MKKKSQPMDSGSIQNCRRFIMVFNEWDTFLKITHVICLFPRKISPEILFTITTIYQKDGEK